MMLTIAGVKVIIELYRLGVSSVSHVVQLLNKAEPV